MAEGPIFITGAGGFIGAALIRALTARGVEARIGSGRAIASGAAPDVAGCAAVIHLAGLAHTQARSRALVYANVVVTARLARAAIEAGVPRFVLASSVLAGGAHSRREALSEASPAAPSGAYGRSKRAAERVLASHRDFSWIALRLPLVHGPGARANFARLMRLAQSQLPAPFAAITARRSLIGVDSAVRALIAARRADGASGAFYVADRPALTVGAMIAALRAGLGHPPGLVAAPGLGLALSASPLSALATPLEADDTAFRAAFPEFRPAHEDSFAALADTARRWDERA